MGFTLPRREIEVLVGPLSSVQEGLLQAYADRILDASKTMNVMSRRAIARLGEHFVDSAAVLAVVDLADQDVVDLGSGGGFPGVVVAVLRPSARVALLDSRRSKVVFLKSAQRQLQLPNLEIIQGRVQDMEGGRAFDAGLSRALGAVETSLGASLRLLREDGRLVLFKGPRWGEEVDAAAGIAAREGAELEKTVTVDLPGQGRATTFVVFHVKRVERRAPG
jgi:16S rRNA (guanine527-N7)-methyltransferase